MDESKSLTLESIRHSLIRQEDSIIFSLLERAQYSYNEDTYDSDALFADGFRGSLVEYMVCETEKLHAQVVTNFLKLIKYGRKKSFVIKPFCASFPFEIRWEDI